MLKLQIPTNSKGELFEYCLEGDRVTIGRRHDNDIRIKETYVSAYHAEIKKDQESGKFFLRDRDSSNGTYHNGIKVTDRVVVEEGDTLRFGKLVCYVEPDLASAGTVRSTTSTQIKVSDQTMDKLEKGRTAVETKTDSVPIPSSKTHHSIVETDNLSSQSDQSARIRSLESELAQAKRDLESTRDKLKDKTSELDRTLKETEEDEIGYCEEISDLKKEIKKIKKDRLDLRAKLDDATLKAEELEEKLEDKHYDMALEVKALKADLEDSQSTNKELRDRIKDLTDSRDGLEEKVIGLSGTLGHTRDGFSVALNNLSRRFQETGVLCESLTEENEQTHSRVKSLETELDQLREDFANMEESYRERLKLTKSKIRVQEKEIAENLKTIEERDAVIVETNNAFQSSENERNRLEELNFTLLGQSRDVKALEKQIETSRGKLDGLRLENSKLNQENKNLAAQKEALAEESKAVVEERARCSAEIRKVKAESAEATETLNNVLQRLRDSEKKVAYLRSLEFELEKSVLRAQRSALSRKGIYSEDGEDSITIWPETEQMICRELIDRLELLEDLLKRYQQSWFFPNVADQLNLLRDSFMGLLQNHSVDQFRLEPGTELSVESRKKIQLISVDEVEDPKLKRKSLQNQDGSQRTIVVQTIRPGYVYSKGGQDVIIRKAEVVVA